MKILLTGSSGFVGKNLLSSLNSNFEIVCLKRGELDIDFNQFDSIIHLAGLAHDLNGKIEKKEYFTVNTDLTIDLFDKFLDSSASSFIFVSSSKVYPDSNIDIINEEDSPDPDTYYGISKLLAESYLLSKELNYNKRLYILRPAMIHGMYNKGNLNLLYKFITYGIPWPFGSFDNKRSYCYIENFSFIISELISNNNIESGIYNVSDDLPLSTNEVFKLISNCLGFSAKIICLPKWVLNSFAKFGDIFNFKFNTGFKNKIVGDFILDNSKILDAINKPLPYSSSEGMIKTINYFKSIN
ncbi:NAD-dependent epimerase/dehydratase family protein [Aquirufa lenticrescens]